MILIEDQRIREDGLADLLSQFDHKFVAVGSDQQAVAFFEQGGCASVLIASYRPGVLELLEAIRSRIDGFLPAMLICDEIDEATVDRYLATEIDGVIVRPIDPFLLKSTLIAVLRMGQVRSYELEQRKQLLEHWQQAELEQEVAAKIYNNLLCKNLLATEAVKSVLSPMALFNGDVLFVAKTPENHLHLLLGDFTGHGLSAAIAAVPTADMFYGMTSKGFSIGNILSEINSKLHKMLPANMFLAATAVALYPESRSLALITCGLPEHFLVHHGDNSIKIIQSKNLPLGIVGEIEFVEQYFSVDALHRLYLFTDGVFEAENDQGVAFGSERIVASIGGDGGSMERLQANLAEHTQELGQKDDISMVKLICDIDTVPWSEQEVQSSQFKAKAVHWKSSMEFGIDALRLLSPVPVIVNALTEIQGLKEHRQAIFLIVNELFANALDHGVLGLDSTLKRTPQGFMDFYQLKDDRLQQCQQGWIRFRFIHQPVENGGRLIIRVIDSGDGFNWQNHRQQNLAHNSGFCGRGLKLLESLCSSLTYHGRGNRVTAVFDWQ